MTAERSNYVRNAQPMSTFLRSTIAEFIKLKRTPVPWFVLIGGVVTTLLVLFKFAVNPYRDIGLNTNPWPNFYEFNLNLVALFLFPLFVILLVSFVTSIEERSNTWKYLYVLPFSKGHIYFSKLLTIVLLVFCTLFLYHSGVLVTGYILDLIVPEFEFRYYQPEWMLMGKQMTHLFISLLGILGFQYWLTMQHKPFLVPLGIGLLGFIVGLVLVIMNHRVGSYFPYTYPMHVNASFVNGTNTLNPKTLGLGQLEWNSIAYFLLFTLLGYVQERSRNVV